MRNNTNRSEIRNMNENVKKVIGNGKLGDIPLVILTSKGDSYWEKLIGIGECENETEKW